MKTEISPRTSLKDSFLYRFHSGEYQMLNGNGTDLNLNKMINFEEDTKTPTNNYFRTKK